LHRKKNIVYLVIYNKDEIKSISPLKDISALILKVLGLNFVENVPDLLWLDA
jgi:hypothetical protein